MMTNTANETEQRQDDRDTLRVVTPRAREEDRLADKSLRPKRLAEYIGQEKVKSTLAVFIEAARLREEPLDHTLLYGPPGLGKTTLASIIAAEMGVSLRVTSGPAIERPGDLVSILTIRPWRTSRSISLSARVQRREACGSTCRDSRLLARRPGLRC
jgi:hypothetical protein